MKRLCKSVINIIISGCLSIVIISLFCLVYNYTGCHITNSNGSTDYKWEKNQYFSTMKEGMSWFLFDQNGYNNLNDSTDNIDILLMGSSHMEAVQIDKKSNVGSLLNAELPMFYTYNIGVSGHDIYTCVQNMNDAYKTYKPSSYIVIETSESQLSQNSMQKVMNNSYPELTSNDSGMIYYIQKYMPAVKSLVKSVLEWKDASTITAFKDEASKETKTEQSSPSQSYKNDLNEFLSYARNQIPESCSIIILYHPSIGINEDGSMSLKYNSEYMDLFSKLCHDNNISLVDVSAAFKENYNSTHELPYGFMNTAVGVGHLNETGHKIVADCISELIKKDGGK